MRICDILSLLGEYSYFISKIEEYKKQNDSLEDAIKAAAKYCIENGILKEFLLKNETEVVVMLLGTYNEEIEKQVLREETAERVRTETETRVRTEERAKSKAEVAKVSAKERAKAAKAVIDITLDFGCTDEEILNTLQKKLELTEKQADEYLKKFCAKTL